MCIHESLAQAPHAFDAWQLNQRLLNHADAVAHDAQRAVHPRARAGDHLRAGRGRAKSGQGGQAGRGVRCKLRAANRAVGQVPCIQTNKKMTQKSVQPAIQHGCCRSRPEPFPPALSRTWPCPWRSRSTTQKSTMGPRFCWLSKTSTKQSGCAGSGGELCSLRQGEVAA